MKWRKYLEIPSGTNGLIQSWLTSLLLLLMGRSYLPWNGPIIWKFHTFTPRQATIKRPGKAKPAVGTSLFSLLPQDLQKIQLLTQLCVFFCLSLLTSLLKSAKRTMGLIVFSVEKLLSFSDPRTNWSYSCLSLASPKDEHPPDYLWIAASPLNLNVQPTSRVWRQTDVKINLCPAFSSSEWPEEESTCRQNFLLTWDLSVISTACSSLPTNILNNEVLPVWSSQMSSTVCLMRLCGCCSLLSTVFFGEAKAVLLLFGCLHLVLFTTVFMFNIYVLFSCNFSMITQVLLQNLMSQKTQTSHEVKLI